MAARFKRQPPLDQLLHNASGDRYTNGKNSAGPIGLRLLFSPEPLHEPLLFPGFILLPSYFPPSPAPTNTNNPVWTASEIRSCNRRGFAILGWTKPACAHIVFPALAETTLEREV